MPNSYSKTANLKQKLKEKFGIGYRRSPEGFREYVLPPGILNKLLLEVPGAAARSLKLPFMRPINLYQSQYDSPEFRTHERIHAAQSLLENQPTPNQIKNILGPDAKGSDQWFSEFEMPAYEFMTADQDAYINSTTNPRLNPGGWSRPIHPDDLPFIKEQQLKYNRYMELIDRLNPSSGADVAEAPMPETLQRNRMMNWPEKLSGQYLPKLRVPKIIK